MSKDMLENKMKKGFTLVEMMIVVAIIAVLAGVAIPQYTKYVKKSETTEAMRFIKQITDAEILYFATNKKYVKFDTSTTDGSEKKIGFKAPSEANFKNYEVTVCGTNDGIIIEAWTDSHDADKTIYSYYPSSMTLKAESDKEYYTGNMYLQDYIDEATTASAVRPQCP